MKMPMRWARLMVLATAAVTCPAATYYVDSVKGADGNSGTEERTPWKTSEKVNGSKFQPGDRILLKSGSGWQGQLAPASSGSAGWAMRPSAKNPLRAIRWY